MAKKPKKSAQTAANVKGKRNLGTGLQQRLAAAQAVANAPFTDGSRLSDPDLPDPPLFNEVSDHKQRLYLQAIALNGPQFGLAAKAAGVCPATGYNWRADMADTPFQDALMVAMRVGIEAAEGEFYRRGFKGYKKPVYHKGRLVGTLKEYDTTAGIFWLKGNVREKYGDHVEVTGAGGGPIQSRSLVATMTIEDVAARMREATEVLTQAQQVLPATATVVPEPPDVEQAKAAYAAELAARSGNGNGSGG